MKHTLTRICRLHGFEHRIQLLSIQTVLFLEIDRTWSGIGSFVLAVVSCFELYEFVIEKCNGDGSRSSVDNLETRDGYVEENEGRQGRERL